MATTKAAKSGARPLELDRLDVPGMTANVAGYDGGISAMLLAFGLTVRVDKNWLAKPGDVITVVRMPDLTQLATFVLKPGDEAAEHYFLSIDHKDLPDGEARLGYVVHHAAGGNDTSLTLTVLVKTDLPGGKNNNPPLPGVGHSELKFSLSTTTVYPPDAIRGVTVTVAPYPNMHAWDTIHFHWGHVLVSYQVAGVGLPTVFTINHGQLVEGGDGIDLLVGFYVVDVVGNSSSLRSTDTKVLVDLDSSKLEAPAIPGHEPGFVAIDDLDNEDLTIELYTIASIGQRGDMYDIDFRAYPALGDVIVHRAFKFIENPGRPISHPVPYGIVRAAAGGRVEVRFVLRKQNPPSDLYSRINSAQVIGSIVRLQAPHFHQFPGHIVNPIPNSAVVDIPWYPWRKSTDKVTLILRYVRGLNDIVLYYDTFTVGDSWPNEAPVKRVVYRPDLEKFNRYSPDLYYVLDYRGVRRQSTIWNESLRRPVQIGVPGR